jgi:outer membrane protein
VTQLVQKTDTRFASQTRHRNRARHATVHVTLLVRSAICLLLATTFVVAQDRPELPSELTLSQALRMALSNSTLLRTSQARLDQAVGQTEQSRAQLLPQLGLVARQSYYTASLVGLGLDIRTLPSKIGPAGAMDARVALTENLLDIAKLRTWQSSRSREGSSSFLVNNTRELVTLMVVTTYLDALRAKTSRDSLLKQTQLAQELYRVTKDRVNQGVSAELDANREMQQVNTLVQQRQEFEQSYVAAKLELASILQAHISADFEVSDPAAYGDTLNLATSDRNAAIQAALTSRADYLSAEANVHAAQLSVESAKATRLPTLRVLLDDGQSGSTPVHNINTYRFVGQAEIPIFTSGAIRGATKETEGALREAKSALDETRSSVEKDVLTALSAVEWALREVETSTGNTTLSQQEVELTRARFLQGISDNTELVNAQTRLSQAEDAHIRARYTLGLARAELARATGVAEASYPK